MNQYSELFEIPKGIYALSHSVGPCPKRVKATLEEHYFLPWYHQGGDAWPIWLNQIEQFCKNIGSIINASSEEICPQPNLASGFFAYLTAICKSPFQKSKNKNTIVMHKEAFASMGFVVKGMAVSHNLNIVLIKDDINDLQAWEKALQQNNVLACLFTHVHSNTSLKSDMSALTTLCRKYGTLALVDIAQSIGVVDIDVKNWQVDAAFGSCVKWLCSGPGAGFMYVKKAHIPKLEPDPVGWFSHENPFEFDINHFKYAHSALRFWGGTPSVAPFVTANSAISTILDIGIENIVTHNLKLKRTLLSSLTDKRLDIAHHKNPDDFGGTLCIKPVTMSKTTFNLTSANVKFDCRNEVIRISLHVFNTENEAQTIADCFT